MNVKDINGVEFVISEDEVKRIIQHNNGGIPAQKTQFFMLPPKPVSSDHRTEYFTMQQAKANMNICKALGKKHMPDEEAEIKNAIVHALASNNAELAAEVLFEAMEWETAYAELNL